MRKIFLLLAAFGTVLLLFFANCEDPENPNTNQVYVSKTAKNKVAIIEEFTGVKCQYCPDGHLKADSILKKYPGKAYVIAYHPQSGGYNTPYPGDEDLRRTWPDPLWALTFSGKQAMPGAFINRRLFGGIRWTGRDKWMQYAEQIMNESSPCNVGFASTYNTDTKILTATVQVYYTADVTSVNTLYLVLTQDDIVTEQAGAGTGYVHKRTFREGLTPILGDTITGSKVTGYMFSKQYTFDNSTRNYNMSKCNLVAFVRNVENNEIYTGNSAKVNASTPK
ncbi:MAG: Omp28-related outer membrane protein [Sphingobacteriales bacterium]|nr:Omp28-related outer membrane protein [Sphingobacteriales bacterium]